MAQKRFTFADAKKRIKDLEQQLVDSKEKAGNLILDTSDNVFTGKELKKIRFLELWAVLGPIAGIIIGLLF
jgi:hypothetical protein|tara:strand:+ start:137 stop:349 length:213 start_codon:yes stop_codon:yes gene_type:complete